MHQLEQVKNTYNLTAREYAREFANELDQKPIDRLLLQRFASESIPNGKVVEFGCGSGHITNYLKQNGVENLTGTDISEEMIRVARESYPGIHFDVANMLEVDQADESAGSVLAFYAIVHFNYTEIERAFKEFFRIMKPGGKLLFSFHVGEEESELDEFLGVATKITFYYFDVDHVHRILNSTGFTINETIVRYPYDGAEYPSKRAYITAQKPTT